MALDNTQATDWATVTTNSAATDASSAWVAALSGVALGVYVDRTLNNQQSLNSSQGYGVNPDGSVYPLGQSTYQGGQAVPVARNNNMLLLLMVGAVVLMAGK
jgi:hypothetical protein